MSISCWLGPTSWCVYSTWMPSCSSASTVSRRTSEPASSAGRAAKVRARGGRRGVEVAALVEGLGAAAVLEVEVLELGTDVEGVEAHLVHALERATEHVARVALVRRALRREDVAEHPPDALALGAPRQDREGR